jgi:predicted PurR-regulated permease PerM
MNQENNNVIDLSKPLNKSATKSQSEQEFYESTYVSPTAPKIIQWLIKHSGGLIKNEKQALYVLLEFIVFVVIISFFLIFSVTSENQKVKNFTPPAEAPIEEVIAPEF